VSSRIFLVAGEASGDSLGAALMRALRQARPDVVFTGVGGEAMAREGLVSLFPISDISVMGLLPVLARLPKLLARIDETARAVLAAKPDCLVIIDSPDFTHRVARRVRRASPETPIVDYVSPTVWAWRPGRARAMRNYVDCVLALLPFEPEAHARLGGPRCVYVGHPLVERLDLLAPRGAEKPEKPLLLALPGSRRAEIERMGPLYGETLALLLRDRHGLDVAVPVAPHMEAPLRKALRHWPLTPRLLSQDEKFAAFCAARAALVTSGIATLELALADTPMVVAYRVAPPEWPLRVLVDVPSIVLPNLIAGENAVPEFLQQAATPAALAAALAPLLGESPAREAQLEAFAQVRARVAAAGRHPSARAASIVLDYAERGRGGAAREG
jgi:lipid-A-disaccharide synthase